MSRDAILSVVCLYVIFLTMGPSSSLASATDTDDRSSDINEQDQLMKRFQDYLDGVRLNDPSLPSKRKLQDASSSGFERRFGKRRCDVGIFGNQCRLTELENALKRKNYLSGGSSPGKRSDLSSLFGLDERIKTKRSCRFRLGGHCITEALDNAAKQYHYLQSADSPGRRRRSPRMSEPLVQSRSLRNAMRNQVR